MSVLVYCLLLILYLQASNARHIGVVDSELYDPKYHIWGKGRVRNLVQRGGHKKSASPSSATLFSSEQIEDTQGNETTYSHDQVVLQEAAKIEKSKRQSQRTLLGQIPPVAEKIMDLKENDNVVEDAVVMDYAQSHKKPPIHN